ncbi:MAG: Winged helix DNA-binding domain [Solirubrobacterales bacterium]|jgi:DNA-binding MarR family transcriptional regulator|nr:Winged helix DNA-binding domain [Solirubrobacterales bacterium]
MAAPEPTTYTALPHLLAQAKETFIREAHRRLHAAGYPEIGGNGVVFRWLDPDGSRLAEMVERSGMTKQAFGEHVSSLEQHGYVTRVPDPRDGRAKLVVPTARGLAARAEARRIFAELEAEWGAQVGAEQLATVRDVLSRIAALPS